MSGPVKGLKPLPTSYRGITFRSRLEARIAACFDKLRIVWEYETDLYRLDDETGDAYLPDFTLPRCKAFVEVKPTMDTAAARKAVRFAGRAAEDGAWVFLASVSSDLRDIGHPDHLSIMRLRGVGHAASTVILKCPNCAVVQPVPLGWHSLCHEFVLPCCHWCLETSEEFWDAHYGPGYSFPYPMPEVPQFRDGRMVWR